MQRIHIHLTRLAAAGAAAALALAACASNPVPDEKIAVAQAAVQRAQADGAQEADPVELATAHDKLLKAQDAAAKSHGAAAISLADQANVDAQLADATAQQKRSHRAATELDASLQALRQESMQSQPAVSAPPPAPQPPTQ